MSDSDGKHTSYVPVHEGEVRDIKFDNTGEYVLTAAMDRTVKVTSLSGNNVIQTYVGSFLSFYN